MVVGFVGLCGVCLFQFHKQFQVVLGDTETFWVGPEQESYNVLQFTICEFLTSRFVEFS